jgi:hypothetical protein
MTAKPINLDTADERSGNINAIAARKRNLSAGAAPAVFRSAMSVFRKTSGG